MILAEMGIYGVSFLFVFVICEQVTAYTVYPKGPGCGALLRTDAIVNSTIKGTNPARGHQDDGHNAVLNNSDAWCSSANNTQQNLTVTLKKPANLSGFAMQGYYNFTTQEFNYFVTRFKIKFSDKEQGIFQDYPTSGNPKTFNSTATNGKEIIYFSLKGTRIQRIAFYPQEWSGYICMRLELYGCVKVIPATTSMENVSPSPAGEVSPTTFVQATASPTAGQTSTSPDEATEGKIIWGLTITELIAIVVGAIVAALAFVCYLYFKFRKPKTEKPEGGAGGAGGEDK